LTTLATFSQLRKRDKHRSREEVSCTHAKVIREILRYLIEHPDAKDTPEGIARWWLPADLDVHRIDAVEKALDYLVSEEWLCRRKISPAGTLYSLNKQFLEEIKGFLEKSR
jgi:hypothetical protein